ncbi:ATP synthase F0 subunit A [Mucilaginibacter sp. PPCGB 2223]|uniref:F0F1 ATP synthase subunit A n=1 Tax=Mucilaginibacter sp. PPCGB 2223 TaxID=1886027 RepID=UPI000824D26E|nr:F0F1 ATP synthase subunit A [Mucilaginibacter sp. PPCGB 2223]OCX50978.1 ATP synthase F0 subunit A [Mucilaginibacter sp. PPCGB 2223]
MNNKRPFIEKFFTPIVLFTLFLMFAAGNIQAQDTVKAVKDVTADSLKTETKAEKDEDISAVILHHIADSHEWHFWGEGKDKVAIPLPVILYTKSGFVTFLSSKHEEDEKGAEIFTEKGESLVNYEGKYYYPAAAKYENGTYVKVDENQVPVNEKPLDLSITKNVLALFISVALLMIIFLGIARSYKKNVGKAPKGMQSALEPFILFVRDDIAIPQLGHKYAKFMPYLLTVFFFIWINNLLGLVPIFPGGANLTGNIALTAMLALTTFIITTVNGNKSYWGHIFNTPGVPWWLKFPVPLMPVVEFIGIFTKPIALMIRLFANITAGHILVLSLIALIVILKSVYASAFAIPFALFISAIELLVGFLQAFIFTILSALFIGMAIEEHHADEHH